MTREVILQKLEMIFSDIFDDEEMYLSEETSNVDIEGWDSLQTIHILVGIEEDFGVRIDVKEAQDLKTVKQIIDAIEAGMR